MATLILQQHVLTGQLYGLPQTLQLRLLCEHEPLAEEERAALPGHLPVGIGEVRADGIRLLDCS